MEDRKIRDCPGQDPVLQENNGDNYYSEMMKLLDRSSYSGEINDIAFSMVFITSVGQLIYEYCRDFLNCLVDIQRTGLRMYE